MKATPCEEVDLLFRCDECGQELWCPEGAVGRKFRCPACARMDFVPPMPAGRPMRRSGAIPIFGAGGNTGPVFGNARLTIKRPAPRLESVENENQNRRRASAATTDSFVHGMTELNGAGPEAPRSERRSPDDGVAPSASLASQPAGDETPAGASGEDRARDGRNLFEALVDCGFSVKAVDMATAENRAEPPGEAG